MNLSPNASDHSVHVTHSTAISGSAQSHDLHIASLLSADGPGHGHWTTPAAFLIRSNESHALRMVTN